MPLKLCAILEAATGLALIASPSLVVSLLFGTEVSGVTSVISRLTGCALLALGIACWPRPGCTAAGMLTYSALATAFLGWVAIGNQWPGKLLWPAVVAHAVLTISLGFAWKRAASANSIFQN